MLRCMNLHPVKPKAFAFFSPPPPSWPSTSCWLHIGIAWGVFKSPEACVTPSSDCDSIS